MLSTGWFYKHILSMVYEAEMN